MCVRVCVCVYVCLCVRHNCWLYHFRRCLDVLNDFRVVLSAISSRARCICSVKNMRLFIFESIINKSVESECLLFN